jgi:hypothetical protein
MELFSFVNIIRITQKKIMSFSLFSFGKKRRVHKRKSVKRKSGRVLPAKVLKLCKKLRIKCTKKVGKKRVQRSMKVLMKLIKRKIKSLKKKMMKRRKSRFGAGSCSSGPMVPQSGAFGRRTRRRRVRRSRKVKEMAMEFGKKRRVSKVAAMKAFKKFYKAHARSLRFGAGGLMGSSSTGGPNMMSGGGTTSTSAQDAMSRSHGCTGSKPYYKMPTGPCQSQRFGSKKRSRFGEDYLVPGRIPKFGMHNCPSGKMWNGTSCQFGRKRRSKSSYRFGAGNPPTGAMMGFEFCSDGGGVLGGDSTGLFASACKPAAAFGARRRVGRPRKVVRRRKPVRRYKKVVAGCAKLRKAQCTTSPGCQYVKRRGCRGRKGTRKGLVYEGPSGRPAAFGFNRF